MAVTVFISATLRSFTNHTAKLELEGGTVEEILNILTEEYPELEKALLDEEKHLRPFVNVYVDDKNMDLLEGLQTKVSDGGQVFLLPVIAGGAPSGSVIPEERRKEVKLDDKEIDRYGKHLMLHEIGVKGQKKIKAAKVLIVGAGGLGSPVAKNHFSFELAKDILSGKYGFMCQYERNKGADTVWSVIYDIKNKKIFRVEGNPSRKKYIEDTRMKFI